MLAQGLSFEELPHNCQQPNSTFSQELCALNGTVGPYELKVVISDSTGVIEIKWLVTYTVWHPPVIEEVDEDSTGQTNDNAKSLNLDSNLLILALGSIITLFAFILLFTRRRNSTLKQQVQPNQMPQMFMPPPMYADVPPAPDFSQMGEYVPPSANEWDKSEWK